MRRLTLLTTLVVALLASLLTGATPGLADPPPNPSDAQISEAQKSQQALAAELGSLQAQAAQLQGEIAALQASADAAVARYNATTQAVVAALDAAEQAKADLDAATAKAAAARRTVQVIAHDAYVAGSPTDGGASLLFADAADVEFTLAASTYLAQRRDASLATLEVANVAASNAETTRRDALAEAERLQAQADLEQQAAIASLDSAEGRQAQLTVTLNDVNSRAATASAALSGLLDQRAAYDAYMAEVARKAAEAAERQRQERAAAAAAAAAAANRGGGGGGNYQAPPPAPSPTGTWALPLRTYKSKSSNYGYRCVLGSCGFHYGVDISAPEGTPMYAVGPGTVVASGPASGFGNWVVIRHDGGSFSVYGHMRVLVARVGQQVNASTLIAYVGSEGQSTGAHLHFEVRLGSYSSSRTATNPVFWLRDRGIDF